MFNIGPGELIVILILALVLLGPEKLPEMARTVGKGMRELRRATEDLKDQVETEFYKLDDDKPPQAPIVKAPEGPRFPKTTPAIRLPPAALGAATASATTDPAFPAALSETQPGITPEASPPTEAPTDAPRDPPKTA